MQFSAVPKSLGGQIEAPRECGEGMGPVFFFLGGGAEKLLSKEAVLLAPKFLDFFHLENT